MSYLDAWSMDFGPMYLIIEDCSSEISLTIWAGSIHEHFESCNANNQLPLALTKAGSDGFRLPSKTTEEDGEERACASLD